MTIGSTTSSEPSTKKLSGLRTNALGFPTLIAQSVALISPTMTAVLIIPLAFASAGQGTWLAYAFGTVMLLFVVFCLNQFAKRSASAGSMYAYTGTGLGPTAGVLSGWTLIWSYFFIAVAGMCGFAVFCGQLLSALGYHGSVHPVFFFTISAALAGSSPTRTSASRRSSPSCSRDSPSPASWPWPASCSSSTASTSTPPRPPSRGSGSTAWVSPSWPASSAWSGSRARPRSVVRRRTRVATCPRRSSSA